MHPEIVFFLCSGFWFGSTRLVLRSTLVTTALLGAANTVVDGAAPDRVRDAPAPSAAHANVAKQGHGNRREGRRGEVV